MKLKTFCDFPFTRLRVTAEGNVAMCCFQRPVPVNSAPYIGNLFEHTLDEIWFGDTAEEIRTATIEGRIHKKCEVPGCPFLRPEARENVKEFVYNEYPTFLEIDLPNTHCNVGLEDPGPLNPACVMCERAAPFFKKENDRLLEVLPKLTSLLPNLKQIHIQGIAEPFYKDLIFKILDLLEYDQFSQQITVSTTTNGTLLGGQRREQYLRRVPRSITVFSIDAATQETYKKIRILPVFEKVLENLYAFDLARDRSRQFIRIHNNINTFNVHEVLGMVHIAHQARVEQVEFNPTDGFNEAILVNESNCGIFRRAQLEIEEECARLNVSVNFLRPLDLGLTDRLLQLNL